MPALAVRALEKRYGRTQALAGVELEVGEGELFGLLGPNGAGKSTLVKIACGHGINHLDAPGAEKTTVLLQSRATLRLSVSPAAADKSIVRTCDAM